jgi:hypothetical protein
MPTESYAATVARHTSIMEELFLAAVASVPDTGERMGLIRSYSACLAEVERRTLHRMEASAYEAQRREGKKLSELARVVAPRRG